MSVVFSHDGENLNISGFSSQGMSFGEMEENYAEFKENLAAGVREVIIDLKGVEPTNYSVLTFFIGCAELCSCKQIKIEFLNLSGEKMVQALTAIGFNPDCGYCPEEYREDKPTSLFVTAGEAFLNFWLDCKKFVGFIGEIFQAITYLIKHPSKLDIGEVLFYMDKSGADAIPIVFLICLLVGAILAFQGLAQMGRFGLEIYVADLVGLALVRELGPLMVGMICIGRAGSAFAAELGTMKVNEEIDAMNTMGLKPARFLVIPKMIALLVAMPMLVIVGDVAGIIGGILIGVPLTDSTLIQYLNRTVQSLCPANVLESVVKGIVFSFIIAGVGCFRGFEAENDAKSVGNATTSSVVTGIFLVVVADALVTFIFPQVMAVFGVKY